MTPFVQCFLVPMALVPLQFSGRAGEVLDAAARIGGLAVLAGAVAGAVAITFRWYARERVSHPPAVLLGVAVVAAYLNATTALGQVMGGEAALSGRVALFNVSALLAATVAGVVGITVGDRLARTVLGESDQRAVDRSLGRVVRAVGRVITVELPAEIEDVPGYDPIDPETKATLEGKSFVFPRGLTVEELRERLRRRLREDYRVGHVDIELDEDGTVTHLGLGSRAAGIGPTLPPESAAMAIRADPAHAASAGDLVQVWTTDPHRRLLNAEVRGTAGEVVTLAIDAADASKLDTDERYKLVTLPVAERADRELTELLRAAAETLGVVTIADRSPLAGLSIAALDLTVVAVHGGGPEDRIETLPARDRVLSPGDSLYVIARPSVIRRIESAAKAAEEAGARASSTIPIERAAPDTTATRAEENTHGKTPSDRTAEETTGRTSGETPGETTAVETEQTDEGAVTDDSEDDTEQPGEDKPEDETEPTTDSQSGEDREQSVQSQSGEDREQPGENRSGEASEDEAERADETLFGEATEEDTDRTDSEEPSDDGGLRSDDESATEGDEATAEEFEDSVDRSNTEKSKDEAEQTEDKAAQTEDEAEQTDAALFGASSDEESGQPDGWGSAEESEQAEAPSEEAGEDLAELDDLSDMEDLTDLEDLPDADDEESADRDPE